LRPAGDRLAREGERIDMGASDRRDTTGNAGSDSPAADVSRDVSPEITVGAWEHLQAAFARAATVADRPVALWLASDAKGPVDRYSTAGAADHSDNELTVQRALARAAATAYARRVKADGLPPEQMLVLVKAATSIHGVLGFGAQALTNDIIRWSIDAYFED